ncbi:MAG: response regulator transcription factor [Corynebacterium sp.]|jgi:DNA-binding NarL/FixJ family response regulator|uniref:response regulator transcription factor n=1 Tax=unclassified Corynebacterium TaxID=2624378 RepID=UPI0009652C10|nr:response regulator transcription factor [Corynebacterium sp. CNJ-954]OLT54818.1 DNA-binding response regulator [Corynebacterium sp. CNJ-954]
MNILLAEDTSLLREGLAGLLRAAGHQVTAVADADALIREARDRRPDLIVSDVRMPPTMSDDGLAAVHRLREELTESGGMLPAVMLSQYVAAAYLDDLLDHGGFGYLLKERVADVNDFLTAIASVAEGGTVVDPEVVKALVSARHSGIEDLTDREREVLEHMAAGDSNTQIGEKLFLSAGAVSKHVANVFMKLGMAPSDENRRVRAVLTWLRHSGR